MEKTENKKAIRLMGITMGILGFIVGWLISANNQLKRENKEKTEKIQKLERNQKPFDGFKESGKCAGC